MSDTNAHATTTVTATGAIVPEVVLPDSKAALRKIGMAAAIAVAAAVSEVLAELLPHVADAVVAFVPVWLGPLLKIGSASLAALLLKYAKSNHKDAVGMALELPPASEKEIDSFYKQ